MNTQMNTISRRQAAVIAGTSLLLMAFAAPFAYFYVIQGVIVEGDPQLTVTNLLAAEVLVRIAVLLLILVILLDLLASWSLYIFLKKIHQQLAVLMGLFRIVYSIIFAVAVANMSDVLYMVQNPEYYGNGMLEIFVMNSFLSFDNIWSFGLIFFSLHLLFLGYLIMKIPGKFTTVLGIFLIAAFLGYFADNTALIIFKNYSYEISKFTFIGELVLPFWLFIKGGKVIQEESI